jgi:DNA-binding XRE family transcriptional regulator
MGKRADNVRVAELSYLTSLGSRVRSERISNNLKIRELAQLAGISHHAVWRLETGRPITLWTFVCISRVLRQMRSVAYKKQGSLSN